MWCGQDDGIPQESSLSDCEIPIPIDLEIRHRGSFEICYYEFRVVYHFSPTWRQSISYYAPKHPKYDLLQLPRRKGKYSVPPYYIPPTVRVWIIPPHNTYQFDVSVRVVGKHYNTAWSDSVTMISDGGE